MIVTWHNKSFLEIIPTNRLIGCTFYELYVLHEQLNILSSFFMHSVLINWFIHGVILYLIFFKLFIFLRWGYNSRQRNMLEQYICWGTELSGSWCEKFLWEGEVPNLKSKGARYGRSCMYNFPHMGHISNRGEKMCFQHGSSTFLGIKSYCREPVEGVHRIWFC